MELTQDKIDLISRLIKNDRKYQNNEDLFDDFFNETCKRSVAIVSSVDNEVTLEAYLRRVVTTSIINVLKDSGRLRRSGSRYMSTNEVSVDTNKIEYNQNLVDYSSYKVNYEWLNIPKNPEEVVIQKDVLLFVAETIKKINNENPEKDYLQIYRLRYCKGMTQKEIADYLNISQSEVSKRIYKLINKVKEILEQ